MLFGNFIIPYFTGNTNSYLLAYVELRLITGWRDFPFINM